MLITFRAFKKTSITFCCPANSNHYMNKPCDSDFEDSNPNVLHIFFYLFCESIPPHPHLPLPCLTRSSAVKKISNIHSLRIPNCDHNLLVATHTQTPQKLACMLNDTPLQASDTVQLERLNSNWILMSFKLTVFPQDEQSQILSQYIFKILLTSQTILKSDQLAKSKHKYDKSHRKTPSAIRKFLTLKLWPSNPSAMRNIFHHTNHSSKEKKYP